MGFIKGPNKGQLFSCLFAKSFSQIFVATKIFRKIEKLLRNDYVIIFLKSEHNNKKLEANKLWVSNIDELFSDTYTSRLSHTLDSA